MIDNHIAEQLLRKYHSKYTTYYDYYEIILPHGYANETLVTIRLLEELLGKDSREYTIQAILASSRSHSVVAGRPILYYIKVVSSSTTVINLIKLSFHI